MVATKTNTKKAQYERKLFKVPDLTRLLNLERYVETVGPDKFGRGYVFSHDWSKDRRDKLIARLERLDPKVRNSRLVKAVIKAYGSNVDIDRTRWVSTLNNWIRTPEDVEIAKILAKEAQKIAGQARGKVPQGSVLLRVPVSGPAIKKPTPKAAPKPKAGSKVKPAPKPRAGLKAKPAPKPKAGSKVKPAPKPKAGSKVKPAPKPRAGSKAKPVPPPKAGLKAKPVPPAPAPAPKPDPKPAPMPAPEPALAPVEPEVPKPVTPPKPSWWRRVRHWGLLGLLGLFGLFGRMGKHGENAETIDAKAREAMESSHAQRIEIVVQHKERVAPQSSMRNTLTKIDAQQGKRDELPLPAVAEKAKKPVIPKRQKLSEKMQKLSAQDVLKYHGTEITKDTWIEFGIAGSKVQPMARYFKVGDLIQLCDNNLSKLPDVVRRIDRNEIDVRSVSTNVPTKLGPLTVGMRRVETDHMRFRDPNTGKEVALPFLSEIEAKTPVVSLNMFRWVRAENGVFKFKEGAGPLSFVQSPFKLIKEGGRGASRSVSPASMRNQGERGK